MVPSSETIVCADWGVSWSTATEQRGQLQATGECAQRGRRTETKVADKLGHLAGSVRPAETATEERDSSASVSTLQEHERHALESAKRPRLSTPQFLKDWIARKEHKQEEAEDEERA